MSLVEYEQTGTIEFMLNGDVVTDDSAHMTFAVRMPQDCLGDTTCGEYRDGMISQNDNPEISISCDSVGSDCRCTLSEDEPPATNTDTYAIQDTQLIITESDGTRIEMSYCVTEDTLVMRTDTDFDSVTLHRS